MYYFIYSCADQRRFSRWSRIRNLPTKFNKFDLDCLYTGIRRRYKIFDTLDSSHPLNQISTIVSILPDLPSHYFVIEIPEASDAMWAKLNAENLTKNNSRYGMIYHGSVGPITSNTFQNITDIRERYQIQVDECKTVINFSNLVLRDVSCVWGNNASRWVNSGVKTFECDKHEYISEALNKIQRKISDVGADVRNINYILNKQAELAGNKIEELNESMKEEISRELGK